MRATRDYQMTAEEYLRVEEAAGERSELVDGYLRAMSGGSRAHNRVPVVLTRLLFDAARASGCEVFGSDMKVRVSERTFYYPDLTVTCEPGSDDAHYLDHPCTVFEVLSPSTERTDRGEKFENYLRLPSLRAYLLVNPEKRRVDMYVREGQGWNLTVLEGEGEFRLPCPAVAIDLADLFIGVPEDAAS
ncbi:MAG TPA: Uma2 family endonuclease [Deinococcales bacterium]|nr:Uma2 family endonuclease [Deinococcales bacterium]